MSYEQNIALMLDDLFQQLNIKDDSVVLVHENCQMDKMDSRCILAQLRNKLDTGTLGIVGNGLINTNVGLRNQEDTISNQERMVLSSGVMLQLLTLDPECKFAHHPSLMLGFVGKFAPYLSRSFELDYPYGPTSVFNDLYSMDAVILFMGEDPDFLEAKYVNSKKKDAIISKNTSYVGGEIVSYLDTVFDEASIKDVLLNSDLVKTVVSKSLTIMGIKYQDCIDYLKIEL